MAKKKSVVPAYRLHKARNQAAVTINGQHIYLGKYNSPESWERYHQEIAKWLRSKGATPEGLPEVEAEFLGVNILIERYLDYAKGRYVDATGKETSEVGCVLSACKKLAELFGTHDARQFGPKKLRQVQDHMVVAPWTPGTVNRQIGRIRRMFDWGVAEELIPVAISQALKTVPGLRKNNSAAKEPEGVKPVPPSDVEAIYPFVAPQVADMLRLMMLTGMRSGEVVIMRSVDIDQSSKDWVYTPHTHKTQHKGKDRRIPLGPKARAVLKKYLNNKRAPDASLFSPAEAMDERNKAKRKKRKSPLTPSQKSREPKDNGKRRPSGEYSTASLRKAVVYGIKATNKQRKKEELPEIESWTPHQVRHLVATIVRAKYGLEASQMTLGHANADVTQIYAEKNFALALKVAREIG